MKRLSFWNLRGILFLMALLTFLFVWKIILSTKSDGQDMVDKIWAEEIKLENLKETILNFRSPDM